jgi:hypothetical protein
MWEAVASFILEYLDPIGIVLGLLMLIPVVWTWIDIAFGDRRRQRKWFDDVRRNPGERPAVLVIDLLQGKDIMAQVRNFMGSDKVLSEVKEDRIFGIMRDGVQPEDMTRLAHELRQTASRIAGQGVTSLHLFYVGPNGLGPLFGAEFANSMSVMLYQHQNGRYENFGPLRHHL